MNYPTPDGPGRVMGPNRQKLVTYLAGATPSDIDTVIQQWRRVQATLKRSRDVLNHQRRALDTGAGGFSSTSHTVVAAMPAFHQSATELDNKAVQVGTAIDQLTAVHRAVKAAIDWTNGESNSPDDDHSDAHLPTRPPGAQPNKADYENRLGDLKGAGKTNYDRDMATWSKAHTAIDKNDEIARQHIEALDKAFGEANASMKIVTDKPATITGGGNPGPTASDPGGPSLPSPVPTILPTPVHPTPVHPTPVHQHVPVYNPSPGDQPPYDPRPIDVPPPDNGGLDGLPAATTQPAPGPGYTPTTPPVTPGIPGGPVSPSAMPIPGGPGGAPPPVAFGPMGPGGLGGRPNLTMPEVPLGSTVRPVGPGVIGEEGSAAGAGARTGGVGARTGGMGTRAGAGAGRGARGARSGAGGTRGANGRRKGKKDEQDRDMWDDGSDWLDDDASGPSVVS